MVSRHHGFALPSILLASVVMLAVFIMGISTVVVTRNALREQNYVQLAREAAISGIMLARMCYEQNDLTAGWSDASPLGPNTDCDGTVEVACPITTRHQRCGVIDTPEMRTTFTVKAPVPTSGARVVTATGTVQLLRKSNSAVWQTYTAETYEHTTEVFAPSGAGANTRYWFFGTGSGLDFGGSGGGSTVPTVAAACAPSCEAQEGSTVVTDTLGNLLFWTNGLTIWMADGSVMPNSNGLYANSSTTQATAFFPLNRERSKYAVITNTAHAGYENEGALYYSVIDMSLNDGKGAVSIKNQPLWSGVNDYSSEALTAAPKTDGSGYWVVTYRPGTTNLIVFEFTGETLSATPHEYSSGATVTKRNSSYSGFGTLNFNTMYNQLVLMAGHHCLSGQSCTTNRGVLRLIDFNTTTGVPTNRFVWVPYAADVTGYSASYSPGENYIYTTSLYSERLYRYKISGMTTSAAVKASEEYIADLDPTNAGGDSGGGQVLRAPNNKMYVANFGRSYLSVINTPDAATTSGMTLTQRQAAIGYVYQGQPLAPGTYSRFGLPQMITLYTPRIILY